MKRLEDSRADSETKQLLPEANRRRCDVTPSQVSGYTLGIAAVLAYCGYLAFAQALRQDVPITDLNALRFVSLLTVSAIHYATHDNYDPRDRTVTGFPVLLAVLCLVGSSYLVVGAAYYIPVGVINSVGCCIQLVGTSVVAAVVRRRARFSDVIGSVLVAVGVFLVTQPPFLFPDPGPSFLDNYIGINNNSIGFHNTTGVFSGMSDRLRGFSMGITSACLMTVYTQLVLYKLDVRQMYSAQLWVGILGTVLSTIASASQHPQPSSETSLRVMSCVVLCMLTSASEPFLTLATFDPVIGPDIRGLIQTFRIPVAFLLQYTVLSGYLPGFANASEVSGAVMVFLGIVIVPLCELLFLNSQSEEGPGGAPTRP